MAITPKMITELREMTGVGIGKCKEALEQAGGDMKLAIENLRKAGVASAVKKESRTANEGTIAISENPQRVAVVEVNAETDFVVKNDRFQKFVKEIAEEVANTNPSSLEAFLKQKFSKDQSHTIDEVRSSIVQAIGENIQVRRITTFEKKPNLTVGFYSHMGGKLVTVVLIEGSNKAEELAKDLAKHVAAAHPQYVNPEDVPADTRAKEEEIAKELLKEQTQGKPANVISKMMEGKMAKFYDEVCLNRQPFIKDEKVKISELVQKNAKDLGQPLTVKQFIRWAVGQN